MNVGALYWATDHFSISVLVISLLRWRNTRTKETYKRKAYLGLWFKRVRVHDGGTKVWQQEQEAEGSCLELQAQSLESDYKWLQSLISKGPPLVTRLLKRDIPSKPLQTMPPTEDKTFKCWRLWGGGISLKPTLLVLPGWDPECFRLCANTSWEDPLLSQSVYSRYPG